MELSLQAYMNCSYWFRYGICKKLCINPRRVRKLVKCKFCNLILFLSTSVEEGNFSIDVKILPLSQEKRTFRFWRALESTYSRKSLHALTSHTRQNLRCKKITKNFVKWFMHMWNIFLDLFAFEIGYF